MKQYFTSLGEFQRIISYIFSEASPLSPLSSLILLLSHGKKNGWRLAVGGPEAVPFFFHIPHHDETARVAAKTQMHR